MKKVLLICSVAVGLSFADGEKNDSTVLVVNDPAVDSLETVIDSMKTKFTKDPIFRKCRFTFFDESFEDRNHFIERLITIKDSAFVVRCYEKMILIKEKEKQLYTLIRESADDYNVKGWVRLHVKKTEAQILTLNSFVMKYTRNDFKIERMEQQKLVFDNE